MPNSDGHILLWLSNSGEDLDDALAGADHPDLIVRLATSGLWPDQIEDVPLKPIYELVDGGAVTDRSLTGIVEWMIRASETIGACGRPLASVRTASGFPLWWCADHSLPFPIWLRMRAIEAVSDLLTRLRPKRVTLWGANADHYWLSATVLAVLNCWKEEHGNLDIVAVPPWRAITVEARRRWNAIGLDLVSAWIPTRDCGDLPLSFCGEQELLQGETVLAASGARSLFQVAAAADVVEADLRWRRGEGSGIVLAVENGRYGQMVRIADGSVRLGEHQVHRVDTSLFHNYILELSGRVSRLYLDRRLVLEAPCNRSASSQVSWGHADAQAATRSEWTQVAWGHRIGRWSIFFRRFTGASAKPLEFMASTAAALTSAPPRQGLTLPHQLTRAPAPGDVCVMGWGAHLSFFMDRDRPVVVEPYAEGILEALERAGMSASFLSTGVPHPAIAAAFDNHVSIRQLQHWRSDAATHEQALAELTEAWRAWCGTGRGRRFPDYRGIDLDDLVLPNLEALLPHLAMWLLDVGALEAYVRAYAPAAMVFNNFASSHRHLIEPLRRNGVCVVATSIGLDDHPLLFYGQRRQDFGCPRGDLYPVWGEWQAEDSAATCPGLPLASPGRTRQDTFVRMARSGPKPGWLQQIGLPEHVKRVIVFADVLTGTLRENILTEHNWVGLVRAMLGVVREHRDVHVMIKPWAGDSLVAIRTLAGRIGDARVHVFDPHASPFHNSELLTHAAAVVSSPTSFLAEFAAMGGIPILLSLPETRFYHGRKLHELYAQFCCVAHETDEFITLLRSVLASPDEVAPTREQREQALRRYFGPSDGHSADRFISSVREAMHAKTAP